MSSQRRLKILIPVQWFQPIGGIEVFISHLLPYLTESFDVAVVVQRMGHEEAILVPEDVRVYELPLSPSWPQLNAILDDFAPDIIHLQAASLGFLRLVWLGWIRRIRLAWTIHQVPENLAWLVPGMRIPGWVAYRLMAPLFGQIVAPSRFIAQLAAHHGISAQVISCGVETDRFKPGDRAIAREVLGLDNRPMVLFVGRFTREKNGLRMLQAVRDIALRERVQLVMVGPSADERRYTRSARKLVVQLRDAGILQLPGPIAHDDPRLPLYYQAANVFALPSLFETQSIATLEALASGLPILTSSRGALVDLVEPGVNGQMCNPLDVHDIAARLTEVLINKLPASSVGPEHAPTTVAQLYGGVYRELSVRAPRPQKQNVPG